MPRDIAYDFFASYASADNRTGWVDAFLEALVAAHQEFTGGRTLTYFLDRHNIQNLAHWHAEIFNKGLVRSRFFETYRDDPKLAPLVRELSWTHNLLILSRSKRAEEREFYLRLCRREKWRTRRPQASAGGSS